MHDGKDFLGLRFQIARFPISSDGPPPRRSTPPGARHHQPDGATCAQRQRLRGVEVTFAIAGGKAAVSVRTLPSAPSWDNFPGTDWLYTLLSRSTSFPISCTSPATDAGEEQAGQVLLDARPEAQFPDNYRIDALSVEHIGRLGLGDSRPLVFGKTPAGRRTTAELLSPASFGETFFRTAALNFIGGLRPTQ